MKLLKIKIWLFNLFLPKFVQQWYIKRIKKQITNKIIDDYVKFFIKRIRYHTNEKLIKEDAGYILGPYLPLTNTPTIGNHIAPSSVVSSRYALLDAGIKIDCENFILFKPEI